ncbi:MarR family transcriptional regulator [Pseudooceanicola algae]|uniref:Uncharacterized protein n=1 Tax=Pseudooceanicola algae TaxID=1537215 RepID=A0A418SFC7_9RHOB|nr:MarR family transcriptional regulator [Pseudooceanicola algae]QPM89345.1 hypothetical protein PSAL_005600 [Pseudooceanicola algae]
MTTICTILSGDLVASTDLPPTDIACAFAVLAQTAGEIASWHRAPVHFTRNRGDAWQICLPSGDAPGLREALALRASLRATDKRFETRIALATGAVSLPPDGNLNQASGAGFTAAGRLLDQLKGAGFDHASGDALAAATLLAGEISHHWTPAQARAVLPMLAPDPPTHAEVAAQHGITRQAISLALSGAGFAALSAALERIETAQTQERLR